MSNLPFTLPGCDQPATNRVEVYTPAPGDRYGSLDAAAYTCDQHNIDARGTIEAAGFATYPVPMAPGVTRTCGGVHIFPTGKLASHQHPAWCDEQDCTRRRAHCSPVKPVDTGQAEETVLDVALRQDLDQAGQPHVSLTVIDGIDVEHLLLSLTQARVLTYRVRELLDAANGGQR